ncbi:hypothetical protein Tco_0377056 [Tanacetum coccineum]
MSPSIIGSSSKSPKSIKLSLKRRVKRLKKKGGSRTHGLKRLYKVGLSRRVKSYNEEGLGEKDASKQEKIADIDANEDIYLVNVHRDEDMFGVNDLEGDEVIVETEVDHEVVVETKVASKDVNLSVDEVTLAQALAALKSAKPKVDKVLLQEPDQGTITTTTAATIVTAASKRPKAKGLAHDKGKGIMVEEPVKMKKKDQISLDEELAFNLQAKEEEEEEEERIAREKAQREEEANIVSWDNVQEIIDADYQMDDGDDVTIDVAPLSTKSPTIVDYKIYKEGKKSYFQIIRADVKARFKKTKPVNYMDNFLLLNLKTMFEHHVEDSVWKNQQGLVNVLNWKLYDSCGVHCVTMQSILYYLLVEKMYPLTNHTLHQIFNDVKLQVDYECEMAFELLRLVKKQLKEGYT